MPKPRPETKYLRGPVWILLPLPHRDKNDTLVGYRYTKTDMVTLLKSLPEYDPFREAEGYYFDVEYAEEVLIPWIITNCRYPEGKDTGKPFIPERWQWAIYLNLYCWKKGTGRTPAPARFEDFRRFTECLVYVPRKNGKTTAFGAVPSLIALFLDPEQRSQNYCCAADTEQASLNFNHAAYMVEQNPALLSRLRNGAVRRSVRLMEHNDGCTLKVLSSIAETKHGTSPCYTGVDEVHAHPDSSLIDVMVTGTAGRDQPLTLYTTTADFDRPSVCNDLYARAKAILEGRVSDPQFLPVIYEASIEDPWDSETTWRKANPNYGISVRKSYLQREARKAQNSPAILGRFLRLHLNIRTAVETTWIMPRVWAGVDPVISPADWFSTEQIMDWMLKYKNWFSVANEPDFTTNSFYFTSISQYRYWYSWLIPKMEELKKERCYGAFDNSAVKDIASLNLWFPEHYTTIPWFWVPAESIHTRSVEDNVPYSSWYAAGLIQNTPLSTISEPDILTAMLGPADDWKKGLLWHFEDVRAVSFDRWAANFLISSVKGQGIKTQKYPQNFSGMHEPCKKVEAWLDQKLLQHGANPVLKWMITHCQAEQHHEGMIRPSKKTSTDKIDGIVSMCMAIGSDLFADNSDLITSIPGLRDAE